MRRASLGPAMISTPGHRASRRRRQPGRYSALAGRCPRCRILQVVDIRDIAIVWHTLHAGKRHHDRKRRPLATRALSHPVVARRSSLSRGTEGSNPSLSSSESQRTVSPRSATSSSTRIACIGPGPASDNQVNHPLVAATCSVPQLYNSADRLEAPVALRGCDVHARLSSRIHFLLHCHKAGRRAVPERPTRVTG